MTRLLPSLALLLAVLISSSLAAPTKEVIEVAIGEPHEVPIPVNAKISGPMGESLPSWMVKEGATLRMIAPPDADRSNIVVVGDLTLEVEVKENKPTGCTKDEWGEVIVKGSPLDHWDTIKELETSDLITMTNIRVVPRSYSTSNEYRHLTKKSDDWDKGEGETVILVKSECGESVAPIVEAFYNYAFEFISMSHGSILSRSSRNEDPNSILSEITKASTDEPDVEELEMKKETTTLPSTTTTRHARATSVAVIKIKTIECNQGEFCVRELEDKTFLGDDGGVHTFNLTIERLGGKGGVEPWVMKKGKKISIGVIPLQSGEHTFMLKGVDKYKTTLASPFTISVKHDEPKTHQFKLSMYSLPSEPQYLHTTLVKLTSFLKRNIDEIKVANVSTTKGDEWITFWNTSLPTTSCPTKEIAKWLRGLHIKNGAELNQEFTKAFTHHPTIHPSRLEVEWIGICESAGEEEKEVKTAGGVSGANEKGGEQPKVEETEGSLSTLITVVVLLVLLLALLILIVCCVGCRRNKAQKGVINEYMSKGTPVVFPDEVDEEHEDVPATAPMLVKEERPPLRVSEHSNPLYKPPPPLTSTAASPRPSAPSAHKLPPPYVPP